MQDLILKDAAQIVVSTGEAHRGSALKDVTVVSGHSVLIRDGIIKDIRKFENLQHERSPEIIECAGKTIVPGFIDAHTHLVFSGTREEEFSMRLGGATYQEIAQKGGGIKKTVHDTRASSKSELVEIGEAYLQRALKNGTTTMEVKSGYGLDRESELKILEVIEELDKRQPVDLVPTFLGAHAVPENISRENYLHTIYAMLPAAAEKAVFCDVFCEQGYFSIEESRNILEKAREYGLMLRLHADQFSSNGGGQLAVKLGAVSADHLEQISDAEIDLLAASDTVATLLPGVAFFLNYDYPPARKIIDAGCIVALASDFNPGSCMCLSMQTIMAIACTQMKMTPGESLNAVTVNAAHSLSLRDVGFLNPGARADILVLDVPRFQQLPYFFGENHVLRVIKNGKTAWTR